MCLQGNDLVINKKVLFCHIIKGSFEALKDQPNIFIMVRLLPDFIGSSDYSFNPFLW